MWQSRYLALVVVVVFIISMTTAFYYRIVPGVDAGAYDRIGWNLARGFGYIEHRQFASDPRADDAILRVGPGYEFFLAGIYMLFGHSYAVVWTIQSVIRALTVLLIFWLTLHIFRDDKHVYTIAVLAAALFGFMPDLIVVSDILLAETLLLFLLTASVILSLCVIERSSRVLSLSAGFFWALSILVRPTALVGLGFLMVWLLRRRRFFAVFLVFISPVLFVGGWSLRNSLLYHRPLFTTTAGTLALWVGNNPEASGGYDKSIDIQAMRNQHNSVELSNIAVERVVQFLVNDPLAFAQLQFKKIVIYFSLIRPSGFWFHLVGRPSHQFVTLATSALVTAVLFIAGFAGMYRYWKLYEHPSYFFLALALFQPLTVIPTYVETRYRFPFFIFLAVFAAYAIVMVTHVSRMRRLLLISTVFFIIITLFDIWYAIDLIAERACSLFGLCGSFLSVRPVFTPAPSYGYFTNFTYMFEKSRRFL